MSDDDLDSKVIAARFLQKFKLKDEYIDFVIADIEDALEMGGSDMKKRQLIQKLEASYTSREFMKLGKIGGGAFGEVYKGVRISTGEVVAIKMIDLEEAQDDIQTIRREILALTEGQACPQLVKYKGSVVEGCFLWIIMELVSGGSVLDKVKQCPLKENHIAIVCKEVLFGLRYMTSEGRIHRDIKSANILLSTKGEVKLADFGATGQLTDTMTKCHTFVGSPFWMAPEVMMQNSCENGYDGKADIWSLGITCIEMATGKPPRSEMLPLRLVQMIPNAPPPELCGQFSDAFKDFVHLCLQKNPEDRPSVSELLKHDFVKECGSTTELASLFTNV